ncbi:hypothetical protein [Corynebacterium amycolatum]|uniref:hypothetical protein n=1 Tax=Corynebacterium amycolatum TaxID=43765 RepID=UPI00191F8E54|nr:hypothetical protein [Corynebacterium amycolatum]QQU97782.1 hypothetical protein I6I65_10695 [Corynebacterium amycolatum]
MEYKYKDRNNYGEFSPNSLVSRLEDAGVIPHQLADFLSQGVNALMNIGDDTRDNIDDALRLIVDEVEGGQNILDTLKANVDTATHEPDPLKKVADYKTAADELIAGLEKQLNDLGYVGVSKVQDVRTSVGELAEALDSFNSAAPVAQIVKNLPGGTLPGHVLEALAGLRQDELNEIRKHVDDVAARAGKVIADLAELGKDEALKKAVKGAKAFSPLLAIALAAAAVVEQGKDAVKAVVGIGKAIKALIIQGLLTAGAGFLAAPVIAVIKGAKNLPFILIALRLFNHHEARKAILNVVNDVIVNSLTAFNATVVAKAVRAAVDFLVLSTPIRVAIRGNNLLKLLNALNIGRILFNVFLLTRIPQIGHLPVRGLGLRGVESLAGFLLGNWRVIKTVLTPLVFKPVVLFGDAVAMLVVGYLLIGGLTV